MRIGGFHSRIFSELELMVCHRHASGKQVVPIRDSVHQYIFSFREIEFVEDADSHLTVEDVSSPAVAGRFQASETFSPQNYYRSSAYWYRVRLQHNPQTSHQWQIEFF